MMRSLTTLLLVAMLVVAGCRTATVHNVPRSALGIQATPTMAEMSEAIWAAGRREGWRVREVSPGVLRAEKTLRTHRALVQIDYDTAGYTITLLEADNLLYDGRSIHTAYNDWVRTLDKSIRDELRFRYP